MRTVNVNRVSEAFWEKQYLPFATENMKPSTVAYKQIWGQHLNFADKVPQTGNMPPPSARKSHFEEMTLQGYRTHIGSQFLLSLPKQGRRTVNHIRALAQWNFHVCCQSRSSGIEPVARCEDFGEVKEPKGTPHYTLEESENLINALIDRVYCQLVLALSCFLGLRPGEIAGLRWEDFDDEYVHIRPAVVRGLVGTPKTPESGASLPLVDRVRLFLQLWHEKCGRPTEGWVFPNQTGKPVDLRELVRRTIIPAVEKAGLKWRGWC